MGLFEAIGELFSRDVYAEEPQQEEPEDDGGDESEQKEPKDDEEEGDEEGGDGNEEDDEDDEDEEDEDEEEPEDLMPKIQEECARTAQCAHTKHEYEECAERVTKWNEADEEERKRLGPKEDCVEEFFEYTHCISQCAAPKLFKQLK